MKTKLFLTLVLQWTLLGVLAQNYYTIKVEGDIRCDDKTLTTGDKLTTESIIQFTGKSDKLYLMSPGKGYFLLTPESQDQKSSSWMVVLKEAIIPSNKYYKTTTRGSQEVTTFDDLYDLMAFFRNKVMLMDEGIFFVDREKIPLDEQHYFEFKTGNQSQVSYKAGDGNFIIGGPEGMAEVELSYHQHGNIVHIGSFQLVIKSRESIKEELSVFFQETGSQNVSLIYFEHVIPYVSEVYGNTLINEIRSVINNDLGIAL